MQKHFNTAGPVDPADHYCIDPMKRLDWEEVRHLIDAKKYFVLHAPRQTGKTSTLLAMMETLNHECHYRVLYVNIEAAQAARDDADNGIAIVCEAIADRARNHQVEPRLEEITHELLSTRRIRGVLTELLSRWAQVSDKPIVLMLDEVDALVGDTLISLLRQIRAGYDQRPHHFPQSVVLCGVRDVRDYRIHTSHNEIITGGSAFNIKAKSLVMSSFKHTEVEALYAQHTQATGQPFDPVIFPALWEDTRGQPWLVNALGHEMTWEDKAARDRNMSITLERYQAARERLIQSRATHLDQLTDKLHEPRVRSVIGPILQGENASHSFNPDDVDYTQDMGLIERAHNGAIRISNRIYREIIPRELAWGSQMAITQDQEWYLTADHRIDMPKLLEAFQQFFRENADAWIECFDYKEAGPHLLLQAFLQRIINGGGRINREYGLGRKRTDLFIEWPVDKEKGFYGEVQRVVLELKVLHHGLDKTIEDGLQQITGYAQQCGADEAHLVIFNRDADTPWEDKIWHQTHNHAGWSVAVWGA